MTLLPVLLIGVMTNLIALVVIFLSVNWDVRSHKYARAVYGSVIVISVWNAWDAIDSGHVYRAMLFVFDAALFLYLIIKYWEGHTKVRSQHRPATKKSS